MKPRCLLLHLYLLSFRIVAVPLERVDWSRVTSVLNFVSSLLLCLFVVIFLAKDVRYRFSSNLMTREVGNAFGRAMDLIFMFAYPSVFVLHSVFYLVHGVSIARLMNSPFLASTYGSRQKCITLFITLQVTIHGIFFAYYRKYVVMFLITGSWYEVLRAFTLYIYYIRQNTVWLLVFYVKYATREQLANCVISLRHGHLVPSEVLAVTKTLAQLSIKFNNQISLLLVTYFLVHVMDAIYCLFKIVALGLVSRYMEFLVLSTCYMLYILNIDAHTQTLVVELCKEIRRHADPMRPVEYLFTESIDDHSNVISLNLVNWIVKTGRNMRAPKFKLYEIGIYRSYLRLRLFELCTVDRRFLLNIFCYVLCYCVLAIQTTNL